MADLRADFAEVNDYFDAIVAENGAVLWRPGAATRLLAAPAHADVILSEPGGEGIARFLRGGVLQGIVRVDPKRWRVQIGTSTDGLPMTIPASRVNLLISGGPGTGKSYLAGLIAEQLVTLGYTLCIFDLEGDHLSLAQLPGVMAVGGGAPWPPAEQLGKLMQQGFGSVVVDLSLESEATKRSYTREAVGHLQSLRQRTGLPHWLFMEEAQVFSACLPASEDWLDMDQTGFCLVTYVPEQLSDRTISEADILISLGADEARLQRRGERRAESFLVGHRDCCPKSVASILPF